jgi:hypothetical protein
MEFISALLEDSSVSQAVYGFDLSQIEKGFILQFQTPTQ